MVQNQLHVNKDALGHGALRNMTIVAYVGSVRSSVRSHAPWSNQELSLALGNYRHHNFHHHHCYHYPTRNFHHHHYCHHYPSILQVMQSPLFAH